MRRTLAGVAAVSAAVGAFLLLWHVAVGPSPLQPPGRRPSAAPPRTRPRPAPPAPRPESPPEHFPRVAPSPRGTLRLFAHSGGQGLAGVRFLITGEKGGPPLSCSSDASGTCSVRGLAAGDWTVAARHPRFISAESRVSLEGSGTVELAVELGQGGRAYGTVTDAGGNALPHVTVSVLHGETRQFLTPHLSARTDESGRYLIEGIPLLELGLHFRSDRHKPLLKEGFLFRFPGDAHEVNATLEEGAMVAGRVVDGTGAPIEGATVTAGNEHASAVRTDSEGRFAVLGLGDGDVNLSASAPGHGTGYLRGVKPGTAGLEIQLVRAGSISGRAVSESPVPAFAVILSRYDTDFDRELRVETRAFPGSAQGEFALPDVAPGAYWVEIEAEGFETVERPQIVVNPGQATANVLVKLRKKD